MINKIKIGLIFDEKETAKNFAFENAPNGTVNIDSYNQFVYETPILIFYWIKPSINVRWHKLNFVYTTGHIRDTIWFDKVIRPMQICGTGIIEQQIPKMICEQEGNNYL